MHHHHHHYPPRPNMTSYMAQINPYIPSPTSFACHQSEASSSFAMKPMSTMKDLDSSITSLYGSHIFSPLSHSKTLLTEEIPNFQSPSKRPLQNIALHKKNHDSYSYNEPLNIRVRQKITSENIQANKEKDLIFYKDNENKFEYSSPFMYDFESIYEKDGQNIKKNNALGKNQHSLNRKELQSFELNYIKNKEVHSNVKHMHKKEGKKLQKIPHHVYFPSHDTITDSKKLHDYFHHSICKKKHKLSINLAKNNSMENMKSSSQHEELSKNIEMCMQRSMHEHISRKKLIYDDRNIDSSDKNINAKEFNTLSKHQVDI